MGCYTGDSIVEWGVQLTSLGESALVVSALNYSDNNRMGLHPHHGSFTEKTLNVGSSVTWTFRLQASTLSAGTHSFYVYFLHNGIVEQDTSELVLHVADPFVVQKPSWWKTHWLAVTLITTAVSILAIFLA